MLEQDTVSMQLCIFLPIVFVAYLYCSSATAGVKSCHDLLQFVAGCHLGSFQSLICSGSFTPCYWPYSAKQKRSSSKALLVDWLIGWRILIERNNIRTELLEGRSDTARL